MLYIKIYGATLPAKRLINSFLWKDSYKEETKRTDSTYDCPLYDITICGGFKMEITSDDQRLSIAPINTNLGWSRLNDDEYISAEIGIYGG